MSASSSARMRSQSAAPLRRAAAVAALAFFVGWCHAESLTAEAAPARASGPVLNFGRVSEHLFRGAQPDDAGFRPLRDLGVKTVFNLRWFHSEREAVERCGLASCEMPLFAQIHSVPPKAAEIRQFLDVVTDPARCPVYVHCAHGKDRTGTMVAVYRMEVEGWTNARALAEMRSYGFHEYYRDLEEFVRTYEPTGAWRRPR